jgi:hypothetical protein
MSEGMNTTSLLQLSVIPEDGEVNKNTKCSKWMPTSNSPENFHRVTQTVHIPKNNKNKTP